MASANSALEHAVSALLLQGEQSVPETYRPRLFHTYNQTSCFYDSTGIDRRMFLFHGRIGFTRNGCLVDSCMTIYDTAIDANFSPK